MKCPKCECKIELQTKRDRETKMFSNYWWCDDCGKVEPNCAAGTFLPIQGEINDMFKRMSEQMNRVMEDAIVTGAGILHIPSPNGKSPIIDEVNKDEI